jgi:C_GCAxxG_C_C family probable redox protein
MANAALVEEIRQKTRRNILFSGCSQSVLLALQDGLGIGDKASFKAASTLSAGVARRGETCGALLGALMALGLVSGREKIEDTEQYNKAMDIAVEISDEFQRGLQTEFGFREPLESTLCRELQTKIYGRSFNFRDPAEREAFKAAGGHTDKGCFKVCEIAAQVAAKRLLG